MEVESLCPEHLEEQMAQAIGDAVMCYGMFSYREGNRKLIEFRGYIERAFQAGMVVSIAIQRRSLYYTPEVYSVFQLVGERDLRNEVTFCCGALKYGSRIAVGRTSREAPFIVKINTREHSVDIGTQDVGMASFSPREVVGLDVCLSPN